MASGSNGSIRRLDTTDFAQAKSRFHSAVDEYIEARAQLENATNALLGTWRGVGRQMFENKYLLFNGKLEDLQDVLNEYNDTFFNVLKSYDDADAEIARELKRSSEGASGSAVRKMPSGIGAGGYRSR